MDVKKISAYDYQITQTNLTSDQTFELIFFNSNRFTINVLDQHKDTIIKHKDEYMPDMIGLPLYPKSINIDTFDVYAYILNKNPTLPDGTYYFQIKRNFTNASTPWVKFKYDKLNYDPLRWKLPIEIVNNKVFVYGDTLSFKLVNNSNYDIKTKDILPAYEIHSSNDCIHYIQSDVFYYDFLSSSSNNFRVNDTVEFKLRILDENYYKELKGLKLLNPDCLPWFSGPALFSKKFPIIVYLLDPRLKHITR